MAMKLTLISSDTDHLPVTGLYTNPAISSTCAQPAKLSEQKENKGGLICELMCVAYIDTGSLQNQN
jgi:hypothetical protein